MEYPNDGLIRDPPYLKLWEFEKRIDLNAFTKWHNDYWPLSLVITGLYLAIIFRIKLYMKNRPAYDLRGTLILWNVCLAAFSVVGFWRIGTGLFVDLYQPNGLHASICRKNLKNAATGFWGIAFGFSKYWELIETLFIVLRKKPLLFLHYYHHVSVLCYVWISAIHNSSSTWFGVMNYAVHSVMYSYYTLKATQVKIPKIWAMTVTALQMLQMVIGVTINIYILVVKYQGDECSTRTKDVYYALMLYGSYFILFTKFFVAAYTKHGKIVKSD